MATEMEKILGGPIGREGNIPGQVDVVGKEFIYFQDSGNDSVHHQFDELTKFDGNVGAKSGGASTQGVRIVFPDMSIFHAIGYRGDVSGWRRVIRERAEILGILLGKIEGEDIVLSNGRVVSLKDCQVVFENA